MLHQTEKKNTGVHLVESTHSYKRQNIVLPFVYAAVTHLQCLFQLKCESFSSYTMFSPNISWQLIN